MNLQQLRALAAFADEGTVTRAAAAVGVSQPALSRLLHGLEDELQASLLRRDGRRLLLTADGEAALAAARAALRAVDDVRAAVQPSRAVRHLALAMYFPLAPVLAPAIEAFLRRRSKVRVRTLYAPTPEALTRLVVGGQADLGFGEATPPPPGFAFTPHPDLEIVLVSAPGSGLPPVVESAALADLPIVAPARSPERAERDPDWSGFGSDNVVFEAEDTSSFFAAVRAGVGSGLAFRRIVEGVEGLRIHRLDPPRIWAVGFIHPRAASPEANNFLALASAG